MGSLPLPPAGRGGARHRTDRQTWLAQAGTDLTVAQFVAGSAVAGAVAFAAVAAVTRSAAVAIVPALAVALLPRAFFGQRRTRRLAELQRAWPDALRHVIGGIQAGLSLNQSIAGLATGGPEALRPVFERFAVSARMVGVPAALEAVKGQLADATSDRVIEVLLLAHERGGRIVTDVLSDLAQALAADVRTLEEIASDRLEPKINSRAVFALPWFVLVLLCATQGPFRAFYRSGAGVTVIVLGAVMSLAGILVVEALSRDPIEERVLASRRVPS